MTRSVVVVVCTLLSGCAAGAPPPATVDTRNDACAHCRMIVSDVRLAAQMVGAGEEPLFFDDIGCLRDYLASTPAPDGAVVYVADHRTGAWVDARKAVFTEGRVRTPMGSGLVAHGDTASRDADEVARGGRVVVPVFAGVQ